MKCYTAHVLAHTHAHTLIRITCIRTAEPADLGSVHYIRDALQRKLHGLHLDTRRSLMPFLTCHVSSDRASRWVDGGPRARMWIVATILSQEPLRERSICALYIYVGSLMFRCQA
uniref:Uncharacterized protein n=1 Tax=Trichogramma kaykai TaxID=54128 RepID=A0ABD2W4L9_9HYME